MPTSPTDPAATLVDQTIGRDRTVVPGTVFERCKFAATRLAGADLAGCRFVDCKFDDADLSGAAVHKVVLQGTELRDCKLLGVDFTHAARLTAVVFERCVLDHCAFDGMDLRRLVLRDSRAREALFSGADLSDAVLGGTDLTGARFGRTNLGGADLRRATGYVLDPLDNRLRGARVTLPEGASLLASLGIVVE